MLNDDELVALDDWRFKARMPSRSAAVRDLLRRGLAAEGYYSRAQGGASSASFGVIDESAPAEDPTGRIRILK